MFPRLPARATFAADTNFVILSRNFVSATNVSQFAQPKKHHGQQCVRNNVSSFTRALRHTVPTSDVFPFWYKNNCNRLSSLGLPRAEYSYSYWVKSKNLNLLKRPKKDNNYEVKITSGNTSEKPRQYLTVFPICIIRIPIKASLQPKSAESW